MPPRSAPTARQRRLGAELRKMRERAGLNGGEAAALLDMDRARISNTESGRFGVSAERVRTFARAYACPDKEYVEALAAMADERVKGWWEEYRGTLPPGWLDLAELEHHARALRSMQVTHIPGLLQTEEYARTVFATAVPPLTSVELRRRLSHRMRRRDLLDRTVAPHCTFIIHEAALRIQIGGRKVIRSQLEYLLDAADRDNVTVRVVPFTAGAFPGSGTTMLYADGAVPALDTVQLDSGHASVLLDAETHLENYRAIIERVQELAVSPEKTLDLILDIVRNL
ncbi:XRE family transcriptional regulator [Streptomyces sp. 8K308]|uniref:helix-turn-helix domain-containing protein n=1 Tax=Streptomyces sp. 8K308 TaxID=2530388 RepID=UPI00104ACBAE|nr:helix-turn-helix transcriptional regulator [Streptomyces sp. 8K308]TDC26267.1 XRE family transcriptional regulator [Streptomyces sp. 8K308]